MSSVHNDTNVNRYLRLRSRRRDLISTRRGDRMQIAQTYDSRKLIYEIVGKITRSVNSRETSATALLRMKCASCARARGLDRPAGRKFAFSRPDTRTAGARYREIYMPTRSPDRRGTAQSRRSRERCIVSPRARCISRCTVSRVRSPAKRER